MTEAAFERILRAAFAMTLTSPFVATAASCGGATSSDPTGPAPSGSNPSSNPTGTATGTATSPTSVDGGSTPLDAGDDGGTCRPATLPADEAPCSTYHQIPCNLRALVGDGGDNHRKLCELCPDDQPGNFCTVPHDKTGTPYVACTPCVIGRRPEGFGAITETAGAELGRYFADAAQLEAASIDAFRQLRSELAARGAPEALLARADRAAEDEIRHTAQMTELALRLGAEPGAWQDAPRAASTDPRARSDEAIAIENAVEGQVRETFGALVALWQASHATDPAIGQRMAEVAEDESRHAALAWAVAAFTRDRLDEAARQRVRSAFDAARITLRREIEAQAPSPALAGRAGLPGPAEAARLFDALDSLLWEAERPAT